MSRLLVPINHGDLGHHSAQGLLVLLARRETRLLHDGVEEVGADHTPGHDSQAQAHPSPRREIGVRAEVCQRP